MRISVRLGAIDVALNAYAAGHLGARQINWMRAAYGLGATLGEWESRAPGGEREKQSGGNRRSKDVG